MQTPFETPFSSCCVYHRTLSRVRVERKALSLRSCIAQFDPWSRELGRAPLHTLRLSSLQKRVSGSNAYQIALFSAFQKGVSNPLIKNSFAFIICKNHPESRLETLILRQKSDDKRTHSVTNPLVKKPNLSPRRTGAHCVSARHLSSLVFPIILVEI